MARIALGIECSLSLGNLEAIRDWGYAPEYVSSMWLMLQQDEPDDYVIATHESHSVREFAEEAFRLVNLRWQDFVTVDKLFSRPLDVNYLQGTYTKAYQHLGWKPEITFNRLVEIMVTEDLNRWKRWQRGEHFPWDASHHLNEARILTRSLKV